MPEGPKGNVPPQEHKMPEKPKEKIYLITPEQLEQLPDGTELVTTFGEKISKGYTEVDLGLVTRGYLPIGFPEHAKPTDIQFDEEATSLVEIK